jgi:hypothetical protein
MFHENTLIFVHVSSWPQWTKPAFKLRLNLKPSQLLQVPLAAAFPLTVEVVTAALLHPADRLHTVLFGNRLTCQSLPNQIFFAGQMSTGCD